jgi:hypothetical protein
MALDDTRARRLIVAAAAAGFLLRVAFALFYWVGQPLTHDEREYLSLARSVALGNGFVYDGSFDVGTAQQFGRAPGYPLFLAVLERGRPVPSASPAVVKVAQAAIGGFVVWLVGVLALASGGPRSGVTAAVIAAIYPPLVTIPAYVLSETLYSAVAIGAAMMLQRAIERDSLGSAALGGALAGIGALIRPALLFFLPLAFLWLLVRRRPALAVAMAVVATFVIMPWTVRNLRTYDRFVLIASEGGVTFWTGNHPLAKGDGDLAANPDLKRADLDFRAAHAGLSAEELEPLYYREALRWIREHPADWVTLMVRKAFYSIAPFGPSYALHSARYRAASVVPYLLVLPCAVLGARQLLRSGRAPMALFLLAASSLLAGLVFFPQERFRIPIVDPVLIVSAAAVAGRLHQ